MTTNDQSIGSGGKILGGIGIAVGALIALGACIVLAACSTLVVLALMGPAIGTVFSNIVVDL